MIYHYLQIINDIATPVSFICLAALMVKLFIKLRGWPYLFISASLATVGGFLISCYLYLKIGSRGLSDQQLGQFMRNYFEFKIPAALWIWSICSTVVIICCAMLLLKKKGEKG